MGTGSGLGDLLGAVLAELSATHPDLSIELTRLKESGRLRELAAGRLGAAVVRGPVDAQITVTTSLAIRADSPEARAFPQAFRGCTYTA